jgi:hypothetical protein
MYLIKSDNLYNICDGSLKPYESPFAEEYFLEDSKSWEYESWKHKDEEQDLQGSLVPRSMLWGGKGNVRPPSRVRFKTVFSTPERLYYVLEMSNSCGLFYYDLTAKQEIRLFHRTEFNPRGLFICEDHSILTTKENSDGTMHLVRLDPDGVREQVLTSGDCRDENPFQYGSTVYYQSSGIARTADGIIAAVGNATINRLDVESDDIETLLESPKFDYLLPRVAPDGTIYCIQTPYQTGPAYPLRYRLLDILLFPWRLSVAIFGFLNVFSILFAKKPLTSAGGPDVKQQDISRRIIHNRMVNAQETWRKEKKKVAVSKDWKLVKLVDGQLTELASNVLWFDIDDNGGPIYTDGYSIFDSSGRKQLEADELISCVAM